MFSQFQALFDYRFALRNFVARELKVMYSNSVLGIVWSLFAPLLMMLVFTVVFTVLMPTNIPHYPIYLLSGLLPWNFFNMAILAGASAIISNGHLVNRVYFPREILPLSIVLSNAINFLIALVMLFIFMGAFQIQVGWSLLWLPLLILLQVLMTFGLSLFLSAINVYFRDTQQIISVLMLALFFLTPIVYQYDTIPVPAAKTALLLFNPMAGLIVNYRNILYAGGALDGGLLAITSVQTGIALVVGLLVFKQLSPAFAEEI